MIMVAWLVARCGGQRRPPPPAPAGACAHTWDPGPEFFSETRWVHGGGAAPRLATDGLPPTPLPRPRHLCGVRGCDRPQVPGMRGRWRSRTALGRGGARGGVSSHLPRGSVEPRCSRMGGRTCCGEVRTRPPPATTGCTGCRHVRATHNSLVPLALRRFSATFAWCRDICSSSPDFGGGLRLGLGAGACGRVVLSAPSPHLSCPHRCTSGRGKRWRHACSSSGWAVDVLGAA